MNDKIFDMDLCYHESDMKRQEERNNVISFEGVPEKLVFVLQKVLFTYAKDINFIHIREAKERTPEQ